MFDPYTCTNQAHCDKLTKYTECETAARRENHSQSEDI